VSGPTYNPVGACIYCGNAEPPLSDEHIVAYGLGGTLSDNASIIDVIARASLQKA